MAFNSLAFALFLPIVFLIYWRAKRSNLQNMVLLAASYIFYGWWDWRFLALIALTSASSFLLALPQRRRKLCLIANITLNVSILGIFKYYNFFSQSLCNLLSLIGFNADWPLLDVLLPVGISFYTFQAISYSVDVYRRSIAPCRNPLHFAVFIAFFPQLVAGPIERAASMLPQFAAERRFSYPQAVEGARRILWGLFKKCVVADGVAFWVDIAFIQSAEYASSIADYAMFVIGILGFTLQLYGDFSGYCDIARGSAQLLGFRLSDNFLTPYFSRNAVEFWHRWHRTLMLWFTNYIYIPLGGSRRGNRYLHVFAVFLLSGLWHGATTTFLIWGILCFIWYALSLAAHCQKYDPERHPIGSRRHLHLMAFTTLCWSFTLFAFRANSTANFLHAVQNCAIPFAIAAAIIIAAAWLLARIPLRGRTLLIISCITLLTLLAISPLAPSLGVLILSRWGFVMGAAMLIIEWRGRHDSFALQRMPRRRWLRRACDILLFYTVLTSFFAGEEAFIYFQF